MKRAHKYGFIISLSFLALPFVGWFLGTLYDHLFVQHKIIEELKNPVSVVSWNENGLKLQDGSRVQLVGFKLLPKKSVALTEATKRGVEVQRDGQIIGLIRIWHTCGNDPIHEHVVRVDLAQFLTFIGEGERFRERHTRIDRGITDPEMVFCEYGWEIGDYITFKYWRKEEDAR